MILSLKETLILMLTTSGVRSEVIFTSADDRPQQVAVSARLEPTGRAGQSALAKHSTSQCHSLKNAGSTNIINKLCFKAVLLF
jgi:hypothetical protein